MEAIGRAAGDHPLAQELVTLVATVRVLVAGITMLASEMDEAE